MGVSYDLKLAARPNYVKKDDADDAIIIPRDNSWDRKEGSKPYWAQQNANGDPVEYNNEADTCKMAVQNLPKTISSEQELLAEDVCARTKNAIDNLVLPGVS